MIITESLFFIEIQIQDLPVAEFILNLTLLLFAFQIKYFENLTNLLLPKRKFMILISELYVPLFKLKKSSRGNYMLRDAFTTCFLNRKQVNFKCKVNSLGHK